MYNGPFLVSSNETVHAIAQASGYSNSAVGSAAYIIESPASTPSFSPPAGSYSSPQSVAIQDATTGAVIHYTLNGTTPTAYSPVYTTPLAVSSAETIQAIAVATGYSNSAVASASYSFIATAPTPTLSPSSGTYTSVQTVTVSDALNGAAIYYTTDGSTPTTSSNLCSGPITVSANETINAIAAATGYVTSGVGSASYVITNTAPIINFASGFTPAGLHFYGSSIVNGMLQITNGTSNEARVAWYGTPVNIQTFTTDFTFQIPSSTADGFTFAIQNSPSGLSAVGGSGSLLGYGNIKDSIAVKFDLHSNAGEGSDSTGVYINGAAPTVPAVDMTTSGVNLHSGDILHAHITYDGTTLTLTLTDTVTSASFTTSAAVNIPSIVGNSSAYVGFTGGTGGSTAVQNVLTWTFL
jgi:hypothetical protein